MKSVDRPKKLPVKKIKARRANLPGSKSELNASGTPFAECEKIEARLRESEELYRHIFEHSPIGIGLASLDGKIVTVNKTMESITGYSTEELKQINLADTYENKEDRNVLLEALSRYGALVNYPVRLKRKDGTAYNALINVSHIRLGDKDFIHTICQDITERKKTEEMLRNNEERLREAQALGRIGNWEFDLATQKIEWSDEVYELYERDKALGPPSPEEEAGYYPTEEAKRLREFTRLATEKGEELYYDVTAKLPSGKTAFFNCSMRPIKDEEGRVIKLFGTVQNITERKKIEESLRESEEKYRTLFEDSRDAIHINTQEGKFIDFNQATLDLLGYTREELLAKSVVELYADPADRKKFLNELEKRGFVKDCEIKFRRKDGSVIDCLITSSVLRNEDGSILGNQGIVRDISKSKRMERTLRESELFLNSVIEQSPFSTWISDDKGTNIRQNQACRELFGISRDEEVIGKYNLFKDEEVIKQGFIPLIQEVFTEGKTASFVINYDFKKVKHVKVPGATHRIIDATIFPIKDATGKVTNAVVQHKDITESRKMEEEIEALAKFPDESPNPVLRITKDGTILYANPASQLLLDDWRTGTGKPLPDDLCVLISAVFNSGLCKYLEYESQGRLFSLLCVPIIEAGYVNIYGRDITDLKRVEKSLQESEDKYRTLFENASEIIAVLYDERYKFVNPKMLAVMGYTYEELTSRPFIEFVHPDDRELVYGRYSRRIRGEKVPGVYAHRLLKKDGDTLWVQTNAVRMVWGGTSAVLSMMVDITALKQVEVALRESEEKHRILIDNANEFISVIQDERFILANPRMLQVTGYTPEEMAAKHFLEIIHPDDHKLVSERYKKRMKGEKVPNVYLHRIVTRDGDIRWMQVNAVRIVWEGKPAILSMLTDITERRLAEEELKRSEQKYESLVEDSRVGIAAADKESKFTFVNQALCQMLGRNKEQLIGKTFTEFIHPDDVFGVMQLFTKGLSAPEEKVELEFRVLDADGHVLYMQATVMRIMEGNEIAGFNAIITDISGRKQVEEERRQWEQKAQVTSRLVAVGEMASGIAHEINNPLTSVIGFSQLLMKKNLNEDVNQDLAIINEGAQRVADIVCKLLTFARQQKIERKLVDINEIISTTLDLRIYTLKSDNIKVVTNFEPELPLTIADAGQLQQVFLNIVMNAEKEMKLVHGKGRLWIKTEKVDNTIRISFRDDGPGIAKENLEKVFNPFFTTREVGEGTGLGLSLSHGIVTAHSGKIWAESKLGKGATFIVELPVVTEETQLELPEPVSAKTQEATKVRILVVDDEPTTLQFLSRLLTDEGHEVDTTNTATEALGKIRDKRYRLILLDVKMPDMNGIELYERMLKVAKSLAQRVIFITGDVMGARTSAFLSKSKAPYIVKPINIEELKKAMNRLLNE